MVFKPWLIKIILDISLGKDNYYFVDFGSNFVRNWYEHDDSYI